MHRILPAISLLLVWSSAVHAHGLLIPEDKSLPPLAMLNHKVSIAIEDQAAVTRIEQTFRNHTDRPLEATYVFPVPAGASVNKLTMWVDGKETSGEMVEAGKARDIYTSIVRRTQDPALLEYMGYNLLRLRVFPIPAKGDVKVALRISAVAPREGNLVEYIYPLKTDGKAMRTLEDFSITATIKSQHAVTNVYSPTHAINIKRVSDKEVQVTFERNQGLLDHDFQMFYATGDSDVGLTALAHHPSTSGDGYFMLLISPRVEISKEYQVPRDVVLVLDTSGSMRGPKMDQARKALRYCLDHLGSQDRFGLINFATTVTRYEERLLPATASEVEKARKWVDDLEATGGTAINDALASALDLRTNDAGRSFTIIFFTDGQPTIGETDPEKILKTVAARNTAETRIFTFGVGDDVNASMLDRLAEQTRALCTYVRPAEDIEVKAASLFTKISNPVLTNLRLTTTNDVKLRDICPPQLPDLFHGGQLVIFGRYGGHGPTAIKLSGRVGTQSKEFVYECTFPDHTGLERDFVENLWARRKVGYLLDQIRVNGEKKELVDEVIALAKRYGIATPYTSYLIVPDAPIPVVRPTLPPLGGPATPMARGGVGGAVPVLDFARANQAAPGDLARSRERRAQDELTRADGKEGRAVAEARARKGAYDRAREALRRGERESVQTGELGVDLSVQTQNLRNQSRLDPSAVRNVAGRNCLELGGVWIDEGFKPNAPAIIIKAQSDAYFRILQRQPRLRDLFRLGNQLVWVTPSGTTLVIDTTTGKEKLTDTEIDRLFVAGK